jgi:hypothetical protein
MRVIRSPITLTPCPDGFLYTTKPRGTAPLRCRASSVAGDCPGGKSDPVIWHLDNQVRDVEIVWANSRSRWTSACGTCLAVDAGIGQGPVSTRSGRLRARQQGLLRGMKTRSADKAERPVSDSESGPWLSIDEAGF